MRYFQWFLFLALPIISCTHESKSPIVGELTTGSIETAMPVKQPDSVLLLQHLDSLPKIEFPYYSDRHRVSFARIILSEFNPKKLFGLRYKRIPQDANSSTESYLVEDEDSSFNLIDIYNDTVHYRYPANWNLIARTPGFLVVEVQSNDVYLATLTYHLDLIDAIRSSAGMGNNNWSYNRYVIINSDLSLSLEHELIDS